MLSPTLASACSVSGLAGRKHLPNVKLRRVAFRRFELHARWPRRSICARPQALVRGRPGVVLDLRVGYRAGRKHLPIVALKRVA